MNWDIKRYLWTVVGFVHEENGRDDSLSLESLQVG